MVNYTSMRPYLIIKNLVTDRDVFVTENSNMANFVNQGHIHGTLLFSTIALRHIKYTLKRDDTSMQY